MKANIVKRVLVGTLSAVLLVASSTSVFASSAGSKAISESSKSSSSSEVVSSSSNSGSGGGSSSESAPVPVTSSVAGVKTSLSGVYLATNVNGTAITTGLKTIADGYALANGETPYARIYNMSAKKSPAAQACINDAAAAMGASVGPAINVEIGKKKGGKFSLLPADGATISLKVGIPKSFAQDGKTFAIVAVRPGGAVSILTDTDTNPDTVTFDTTAGQAAYALIKY
ncbi:MAG: hypothetical protein NC231_06530 [Bacillus sp. (in: Bacteria)]|nr:hypothetical protein [Bacillus sp. (in: firmicutes)]MCM1426743.1 hypothetical protein [Eubacterium sp.]